MAVLGNRSFIMSRNTVYPKSNVILKEALSVLCGGRKKLRMSINIRKALGTSRFTTYRIGRRLITT